MWSRPRACCLGKTDAFADAGYRGVRRRPDAKIDVQWHVAMRPGLRKLLDMADSMDGLTEQVERIKASIRAKVEHPFRVIKRQFGPVKVHVNRSLAKNTAQLYTLFALANLWMVRRRLSRSGHECIQRMEMGAKRAQNTCRQTGQPVSGHVSTSNHGQRSYVQTVPSLSGSFHFDRLRLSCKSD